MVTAARAPRGWLGGGAWSWRDLRSHWIAVVAIALVLAIGTGVYGFGQHRRATAVQRRQFRCAGNARPSSHAQPRHVRRARCAPRRDRVDRRRRFSARRHRTSRGRQSGGHGSHGRSGFGVGPGSAGRDDVPVDTTRRRRLGPRRHRTLGDPTARSAVLEAKFADQHSMPTEGTVLVAERTP